MKVLVATKERAVFDILRDHASAVDNGSRSADSLDCTSVLTTGKIYEAIPDVQLAIVDYADLIAHPFSPELIRRLLEGASLKVCSSSEFLDDPKRFLTAERLRQRRRALPPKRTIAFTSYSGGTGKTSLALDTALHFAEQTRETAALPTALFELTYGSSALQALLGLDEALSLYDLVSTPDLDPPEFGGVSLYPMDYDQVRLLPSPQVSRYLQTQVSHYVLTVIDTPWPPVMVSSLQNEVDLWIVVTTPRVDAVENARRLRQELSRDYGEEKVILAVNRSGGFGTSLALMGTRREIELSQSKGAGVLFEGRLGREVLTYVYGPLWREMRARRRGWRPFRSRKGR
jgi:hypothetical protein